MKLQFYFSPKSYEHKFKLILLLDCITDLFFRKNVLWVSFRFSYMYMNMHTYAVFIFIHFFLFDSWDASVMVKRNA